MNKDELIRELLESCAGARVDLFECSAVVSGTQEFMRLVGACKRQLRAVELLLLVLAEETATFRGSIVLPGVAEHFMGKAAKYRVDLFGVEGVPSAKLTADMGSRGIVEKPIPPGVWRVVLERVQGRGM